jgi:hypothetical protein
MKTTTSAFFLVLIFMFGLTPPARAEIYYPWCADYGGDNGGGGTNCGWSTLEQCMTTIHGMGGFCRPNPFYTGPKPKSVRPKRKRHSN